MSAETIGTIRDGPSRVTYFWLFISVGAAYSDWGGGVLFFMSYFTLVRESNWGNESGVVLIILSRSL